MLTGNKKNNNIMKKEWIEKGFVDEQVDTQIDLKKEIRQLCKEKDAVLLAHYYTLGEVQEVPNSLATRWRWRARLHRPMPR